MADTICPECGRFLVPGVPCAHVPLPASPLTDDTRDERQRQPPHCACRAFRLRGARGFVVFPDTVHTPDKCGAYVGAQVVTGADGKPYADVAWRW